MIETKDYLSLLAGFVLTALGLLPLLANLLPASVPSWFAFSWVPTQIFSYLVAIFGFYLAVESIIEITNSNHIGWWSFLAAVIFFGLGLVQIMHNVGNIGPSWFSFSWIPAIAYYIIFIVEGLFLMIACFAMEM
ncbi:hypothetical protein HZB02_04860 [Candidatus Woesearchaeota archaeon]|nr:hypothetical protein [Candidatus Woesearchaeota archaeon]